MVQTPRPLLALARPGSFPRDFFGQGGPSPASSPLASPIPTAAAAVGPRSVRASSPRKQTPYQAGMKRLPTKSRGWQYILCSFLLLTQHLVRLRFISRSEEHTSELQSLMRISYAVFC